MLIGSRAIAHWNKNFKVKPGADWDIVDYPTRESFYRREFFIPDNERIEWHRPSPSEPLGYSNLQLVRNYQHKFVCNPYGLAIIYRSHLHRDWNWDGHICKYHRFIVPMLSSSDLVSLKDDPLLLERIKLTKQAYPQGNPKLNKSNMDFFDDPVTKVYDHDFLHELYAYEDRPMFEKLKRPEQFDLAWCAKDLWDDLSQTQKLQCVAEETYVIATERFMIPNNWDFATKRAYYRALKKVCTTLTSGWFRDFAIDNFPEVYNLYEDSKFSGVHEFLTTPSPKRASIRYHNKGEM